VSCASVDWNPYNSIGFARAAMRLYNFLTKSNSFTIKKVLHADMQLSTKSNDCWSAHILSAIDDLTQSYIFKQKLQNCEPIDLSRYVVDLRERHMENWANNMSYAVQLVSDFVFTPYALRQRHGIKVISPPVTCVIQRMSKMNSMFFSTAESEKKRKRLRW